METTSPKEELPLKEVKKLHFLIHPGYKSDPAEDYREDLSESDERYTQWNPLLNSYVDKARELPTDEIMIVMLHANFKNLLNDFKHGKEYTGTLRSLKKVLGRRMIALSDDYPIEEEESFYTAKDIANTRGFYIPRNVYSEAYGEQLEHCVPEGAQMANKSFRLHHKTIIKPDLTDYPESPRKQWILDAYDRVQMALEHPNDKPT
jgi:hypothetical protein